LPRNPLWQMGGAWILLVLESSLRDPCLLRAASSSLNMGDRRGGVNLFAAYSCINVQVIDLKLAAEVEREGDSTLEDSARAVVEKASA
jgi:hypothetical protein